jgi:hypothetical protein
MKTHSLKMLLLGTLLGALPLSARDWYVATTGTDALGRGSIDQPVRTIQWLLDTTGHNVTWQSDAQPGDTIIFRGGDYPTQELKLGIPNLTIRAYNPTTEPVRWIGSRAETVAYTVQFSPPASGCRLDGIEIIGGGYYALKFEGEWDYDRSIPFSQRYKLSNITISNCRIYDTGRDGIKITPGVSDITIRGCEVFNTGLRDSSNADGIDCVNGTRILVQDCAIHHTATQGLYFKGGSRDCIVERTRFSNTGEAGVILGFYSDLDWFDTDLNPDCYENIRGIVRNCIISDTGGMGLGFYAAYQAKAYNNTFINVNTARINTAAIVFAPGAVYGDTTSYFAPNVAPEFVNNIVVQAPTDSGPVAQIRVADSHPGLTGSALLSHNRWFKASGSLTFVDQRSGFAGSYAQWAGLNGETGSSVGDPGLSSNGHLLAASACIGNGVASAIVVDDFDKQTRLAPFDIGADEYTAPQPSTFSEWRAANFSGADASNNAVSGPLADPEGTGLTNLQRYAHNLPAHGPVNYPVALGITSAAGQTYLTLSFDRLPTAPGLTYTVEASNDLRTWTAVPGQSYTAGTPTRVPAQDSVAIGTTPRRFLRLRVSTQ